MTMRPSETNVERITAGVLALLIAAWLVVYAYFAVHACFW